MSIVLKIKKSFTAGIFVILMFLFLIQTASALEPSFEGVHYSFSSDGEEIKNLMINTQYNIDYINDAELKFVYLSDEHQINAGGVWKINFIQENEYDLSLDLVLNTDFSNPGSTLGAGMGLGFESQLQGDTNFFARSSYFLTGQEGLTVEGGITLPVISSHRLSISLGNNYWQRSAPLLSIGFIMKR